MDPGRGFGCRTQSARIETKRRPAVHLRPRSPRSLAASPGTTGSRQSAGVASPAPPPGCRPEAGHRDRHRQGATDPGHQAATRSNSDEHQAGDDRGGQQDDPSRYGSEPECRHHADAPGDRQDRSRPRDILPSLPMELHGGRVHPRRAALNHRHGTSAINFFVSFGHLGLDTLSICCRPLWIGQRR